ncbi:hypothetical protein QNI19_20820 [Cytophagaceae bacterium DM2B3-1]|uniref:Uncharacterized protein n=2 Tax=Xanthocytophaga TaxID=3078918 RepID=A0AAE3QVW2_9BACT|nr:MULTISPECIES: hypothetical protein [Xanthocytophaga]MDJ1473205.1 hypothetical protein [Xanthocytophaga flavus]MDJ1484240.1 hypothetical protein [Xanthocytophaga flavus]MDJ1495395.1 hypothetical protein [Xanthocytophaga flavus]MDJ1503482.1 hypothetical protein [Xanthocytophaga agilis]
MDLTTTMEKLALEIDGRFVEYSYKNTIITVPLNRDRFQSVTGYLIDRPQGTMLEFMSTVCTLRPEIDHRAMLELNQELYYSKVMIHEGFLKVAAAALFDHCTEDLVKDMIMEVAYVADDLEMRIIGHDIY